MIPNEYPRDIYIKLEALAPYYEARISVFKKAGEFSTEVSIVNSESGKIYQYVGNFYKFEDEKEAIDSSIQKLSHHFKNLQKN